MSGSHSAFRGLGKCAHSFRNAYWAPFMCHACSHVLTELLVQLWRDMTNSPAKRGERAEESTSRQSMEAGWGDEGRGSDASPPGELGT